ncbi:MAG TPA: hypothetical protein PLR88_07265 [Bacteroidales bacterium]|nr:hypothetical protein [Bacteroidales bacterium]
MDIDHQIPEPFLLNPLKHHLGFIKEFINRRIKEEPAADIKNLIREIKHLGTSVMDIHSGSLTISDICKEIMRFLLQKELSGKESFRLWIKTEPDSCKIITLSDGSEWAVNYYDDMLRFVHIFPARNSLNTFRVKANTLKTAVLYCIMIGKDYITGDDLNKVRSLLSLSPVKDTSDTEAITEMIEILRN